VTCAGVTPSLGSARRTGQDQQRAAGRPGEAQRCTSVHEPAKWSVAAGPHHKQVQRLAEYSEFLCRLTVTGVRLDVAECRHPITGVFDKGLERVFGQRGADADRG
jgi:hypothetical protein